MSFTFKQFYIDDSNTPMKVGVDGVMLGTLSETIASAKILDVGAGSGLVSLMMAQKYSDAHIYAVEINEMAYEDCVKNFENSSWKNRLEALNCDFKNCNFKNTFDLIVSNPPFFDSSIDTKNSGREIARTNKFLTMVEFFDKSNTILNKDGVVSIIFPYEQREELIKTAFLQGFYLFKETRIKDTEFSNYIRTVLSFTKSKFILKVELDDIFIKSPNGEFSKKMNSLTADFYL